MYRNSIKVIKRNKEKMPRKIAETAAKAESRITLQIMNSVKTWVTESVETRRVEKVFSDRKIKAWNKLAKNPLSVSG